MATNYNSGRQRGARMMPEVMALNKQPKPTGTPAGRMGPPQPMAGPRPMPANAQRYAKGGKVHKDEKQDRALIEKMMKAATGKKPIKRAVGGIAKQRRGVANKAGAPIKQPRGKLVPGN